MNDHPAPANHIGFIEGMRQTGTLACRTLIQIRRNPWELGDFSIQPILFLVLFMLVFGGAISGSLSHYLTFILPGIIVMNLVFVTVYVGHGLNTDLTKGFFDRMRSMPLGRWAWATCWASGWRPRSSGCWG